MPCTIHVLCDTVSCILFVEFWSLRVIRFFLGIMSRRGVASGNARIVSPEKIWYCCGCPAVKSINLTPSNGWTLEQTNFTATRIVQSRACLCKWAFLRNWACFCKRGDAPFRESRRHTQALLEIEDNFDANPENWAADPGEYGFRKVHHTPVRIF